MKYPIYKNLFFEADIEIFRGRTKVTSRGILAPLLRTRVSREMSFFDNQKYIFELMPDSDMDNEHANYLNRYGSSLIFSTWMAPIPSPAFSRQVKSRMMSGFGCFHPEQVTLSITEECPNRCLHCALPNKNNHSKLSPTEVKDAIDQCVAAGATNIIFDGGEPLGYAGLEDLISHVPETAVAGLFTSGVGLTFEKAKSLKDAGLYSISVSFDSPFEEKHDHMRGVAGIFKKAAAGVKNAVSAGLLVNMYVVLAPYNVSDLEDFYRLSQELGAHELSFYEIVPTGRWLDNTSDILTKDQHAAFESFVRRHERDGDAKDSQNIDSGPKIFPGPLIVQTFGCMAGRQWLHITPEGNILPCSCVPISYGNIKDGKNAVKTAWKKIRKDPAYGKIGGCLMRDKDFREKYGDKFE
ncbi:radical SAM protein [Methanolapillus ohkumae]|uniref:PqqA peptide cyclase n=1 Tax=Methanolapillus ohkumae TaxID=3028298 RepID=A0AA96ZVA3_9EURY|nr:PqqA peptide cyclase [Methanosarcinaceae archaeon Am2]